MWLAIERMGAQRFGLTMRRNLIFIDCDSTLSEIEGIDELARMRGPETFQACKDMTNRAMDGEIRLEDVYGERLKLIRPTLAECRLVGQLYIDTVEPNAVDLIRWLASSGWEPIIISGGITQAIEPFAAFLGVGQVEAVNLIFGDAGDYEGFLQSCPTSRMGGKIELINRYKAERSPERVVMVGDGSSDLETKDDVDLFIGFGGYIARDLVRQEAPAFATSLAEIPALIEGLK